MPNNCNYCSMKILNSEATIGDKHFHHECCVCSCCKISLQSSPFRMRENVLYCDKCFKNTTAVKCAECNCIIRGKNRIEAMGQFYHPRHLVCFNCKCHLVKPLFIKKFMEVDGKCMNYGFCINCAEAMSNTTCSKCSKPLDGNLVFDGKNFTHMDCDNVDATSNDPSLVTPSSSSSPSSTSSENEEHSTPVTLPTRLFPVNHAIPHSPVGGVMMSPKKMAASTPGLYTGKYDLPSLPTEVVSSEALDHMHNFTSEGAVTDRAQELANYKSEVKRPEDVMAGFNSEGAVVDRAKKFGKDKEAIDDGEEEEEARQREKEEKMKEGFSSQGAVVDRASKFGKNSEVTDDGEEEEARQREKEEKMKEGFSSNGNVLSRAQKFGKDKEAIDDGEEEEEARQREKEEKMKEGFSSKGSVLDRASMFGKNQKTIDDEEKETKKKETKQEGFSSKGSVLSRASMFGKKGGAMDNSPDME